MLVDEPLPVSLYTHDTVYWMFKMNFGNFSTFTIFLLIELPLNVCWLRQNLAFSIILWRSKQPEADQWKLQLEILMHVKNHLNIFVSKGENNDAYILHQNLWYTKKWTERWLDTERCHWIRMVLGTRWIYSNSWCAALAVLVKLPHVLDTGLLGRIIHNDHNGCVVRQEMKCGNIKREKQKEAWQMIEMG